MSTPAGSGEPGARRPPALEIDLATPDPIPDEGIQRATEILRSGKLFRYDEDGPGKSEAALWEEEFAEYVGRRFAVAVNSCGSAMYLALHAMGVRADDPVLLNSWTLAPVPGAVQHIGARAVLVETTPDLTIDLDDLEAQARAHPGSVLLLSHMRGHVADMSAVMAICHRFGVRLVEDCAHSIGATWDGTMTGTRGQVGCFSMQTYKHLNAGEGGMVVTDDPEVAARVILASGSYMLYGQHTRRPPVEDIEVWALGEPNHSMRMTSLGAAILRPQLRTLPARVEEWNARYGVIATGLANVPGIRLPRRPPQEGFVGSSIQFFLSDLAPRQIELFCEVADDLGVHVKWFGAPRPHAFTSQYRSWAYAPRPELPQTNSVLAELCDIRIPLALPLDRCGDVIDIVQYALTRATDS